jgi:hypothetical protein
LKEILMPNVVVNWPTEAEARDAYYAFIIELSKRGVCDCRGGCERSATGADREKLDDLLRRWERLDRARLKDDPPF